MTKLKSGHVRKYGDLTAGSEFLIYKVWTANAQKEYIFKRSLILLKITKFRNLGQYLVHKNSPINIPCLIYTGN